MPQRLTDMLQRDCDAGLLMQASAKDLVHGSVRVAEEWGGWYRPWRLGLEQVRSLGSCQAWHPGLYRQMARTTAGVCLEFTTDATEVAVEVLLDDEPSGTSAVLDIIRQAHGVDLPYDGLSADVDGRHLPSRMPGELEDAVAFSLDDPSAAPSPGLMMLPGFGDQHHVRIWLPALRGCAVRRIWGNGTFIEPVDQRDVLLVLGDSVAQGFATGDPGLSWPVLLADRLGMDVVNQGIGGQVFQPGTLRGLASSVEPKGIVVALGENYRFEPCQPRLVARDIRSYLGEVAHIWTDVPTWVCTPAWHDENVSPSHRLSCWERVPSMIAANASVHDQMALVDGLLLHDHAMTTLADADGHPNAKGASQMAGRLHLAMRLFPLAQDDQASLRAKASELLEGAPRVAIPVQECLRRGMGKVLFAEQGCVLVEVDDDLCLVYGPDEELASDVVAMLVRTTVLGICGAGLDEAAAALGLTQSVSCHVATWRKSTPMRLADDKDIRLLDASFSDAVRMHLADGAYLPEQYLLEALANGAFLGGFEQDELVGFVGEHVEGAFGYLEVFEGHERKGWEKALVAAKVNQTLRQGHLPWCEVFPKEEATLSVQRRLGLSVGPVDELRFMRMPDETDVAHV